MILLRLLIKHLEFYKALSQILSSMASKRQHQLQHHQLISFFSNHGGEDEDEKTRRSTFKELIGAEYGRMLMPYFHALCDAALLQSSRQTDAGTYLFICLRGLVERFVDDHRDVLPNDAVFADKPDTNLQKELWQLLVPLLIKIEQDSSMIEQYFRTRLMPIIISEDKSIEGDLIMLLRRKKKRFEEPDAVDDAEIDRAALKSVLMLLVRVVTIAGDLVELRKPLGVLAAPAFTKFWRELRTFKLDASFEEMEPRQQVVQLLIDSGQLDEQFLEVLLSSKGDAFLTREYYWSTAFFDVTLPSKYKVLRDLEDSFYLQLIDLCVRLETLALKEHRHREEDMRRAGKSLEELGTRNEHVLAENTINLLNNLAMYGSFRAFLSSIWVSILERSQREGFETDFSGFDAKDLLTVVQNGQEVSKRLRDLPNALTALTTKFKDCVKKDEPKKWAKIFEDSAKTAYNLQYMFREDIELASRKFTEALQMCPTQQADGFGNEREMFRSLLEKSLEMYGRGLLDHEALAKTNFVENPQELINKVMEGVQGKSESVQMIGRLTAEWMKMKVADGDMPLTPHHTQVRSDHMRRRTRIWLIVF